MINNELNDKDSSVEERETTKVGNVDVETEENFEELFKQSLQEKTVVEGQVIKGTVVGINQDEVLVDIGYKSEGIIPANQFNKVDGKIECNVGDEIEIVVEKKENDYGQIILSKEKADSARLWVELEEAHKNEGIVKGVITSRVKGGFAVDIGVKAFLPASQVDNKPIKNFDRFVGEKCKFKILEFNRQKGNIVLSRKVLLEDESKKMKDKLLKEIHEGMVLDGNVKNITDYGVFVDFGSIDGLLHITDISWGRVSHPSDVFNVGDSIKVIVLKYDKEKQRISLGHKQISEDPWKKAEEKYPIGSKVKGKVVTLVDYGAFVEIENGIEGLVHISEMSWTKRIKHPSKILNVGDVVETVVLALDVNNRRLSLGLKQIEENPWDLILEKYPVGTIVEKPIKNITDFGIFVEFENGIDGLVHVSDISWSKKTKNLKELYNKGDVVKVKVMEVNPAEEKCSLSIKDVTEDPWKSAEKKFKKGNIVKGVVKSITEFGAFVELDQDIEGLIHISEIKAGKATNTPDHIKIGEEIKAMITFFSSADKRISLSIKDLEKKMENDEVRKYLANQKDVTAKLMDFVKKDETAEAAPTAVKPEVITEKALAEAEKEDDLAASVDVADETVEVLEEKKAAKEEEPAPAESSAAKVNEETTDNDGGEADVPEDLNSDDIEKNDNEE